MTEIKERPILMKGEMVTASLKDVKTRTRRGMKPQPLPFEAKDIPGEFWHIPFTGWPDGRIRRDHMSPLLENLCPYGNVGDRLWVRETFYCNSFDYPEPTDHARENLYYRANPGDHYTRCIEGEAIGPWRPSIFMPRWACRLLLEITSIRVERLQDISEEDAYAEGSHDWRMSKQGRAYDNASNAACRWTRRMAPGAFVCSHRGEFAALWESINGKRPGFTWMDNPWVWVIEYKRVEAA